MKWVAAVFFLSPALLFAEDPALWSRLDIDIIKTPQWRLSTAYEHRTSEALEDTEASLATVQLHHLAIPHVELGLNATYLDIPALKTAQERLELECNPHGKVRSISIHVRHRYEFTHTNGLGDTQRLRQRWKVEWPICGSVWSIFHCNEFFYDVTHGRSAQNRFVPVGVKYRISEKAAFDTFYMLRRTRTISSWPSTHIVGVHLRYGPLFD